MSKPKKNRHFSFSGQDLQKILQTERPYHLDRAFPTHKTHSNYGGINLLYHKIRRSRTKVNFGQTPRQKNLGKNPGITTRHGKIRAYSDLRYS